jgi:choline kinase/ubiquinone/menaquinone biosynthesis C-methylase UbiE
MKAIILAAGEGKRFGQSKVNKPKCLMEVGESTLLNIQIDTLYECGINDIVMVRGYEKNKIDIPGIRYYDNDEYKETKVLYSLFKAEEELNEDVLVLYSDIYYEKNVIKTIMNSSENISIGCLINYENLHKHRSDISLQDMELVDFDSDNRIRDIGKDLSEVTDSTRGQFIGIFKLSPKGCDRLKKFYRYFMLQHDESSENPYKKAWITDLFAEMIQVGAHISVNMIESGWFEMNTYDDYQALLKIQSLKDKYLLVHTDWKKRSEKYNNLDWVNNDQLLIHMGKCIVEISPESNILDVGTGTGKILIYLKMKKGDANYFGCDISPDMMSKINDSYNFNLKVASVTDLSEYPDSHFDYITARMIFHHVDELDKAMQEIHRKLKKGGKFIICEGNPPSYMSYQFYKDMFFYKEIRNTFMESDMINLFARNGYQNIRTETMIMPQMSLNNWIDNSGLPQRNIDIIKKMHYNCSEAVHKDYNMTVTDNDILMDWKFSVVMGER